MLDSGAVRHGFTSKLRRCRVTVLGRLFTHIVPLFTQQQKVVAVLLRVARVTAGLEESNGRFMTHIICRLTAKNGDQLRDPMLGNHIWATFTFLWSGIT